MPLCLANAGDQGCIVKITGKDEVRQHLAELGFVVGENVMVVSKMGDNMIVTVKDCRVALDKSMTSRIII